MFDWIDVLGDGNCGFRAIAATELGGEDAWPLLKRAMCMEMQMNRDQYLRLYLSQESLDDAIFRIGSHGNGPAPYIHWMDASMALYSAATFLNIGIAYHGSADSNLMYNCLVLPLRKAPGVHSVNKVIHICSVNGNHFVIHKVIQSAFRWTKTGTRSFAGDYVWVGSHYEPVNVTRFSH